MIEYAVLLGMVIAITQVIKKINKPLEEMPPLYFNESYIPLVAVFTGVVLNAISMFAGSEVLLDGIIAGLVAVGAYDGGKSTIVAGKELSSTVKNVACKIRELF